MYGGCMVILIACAAILLYLFPVMAREEYTFKGLLSRVSLLAADHIVITVSMLTVAILTGVAIANGPVLIGVLPGFFCFLKSIFLEHIFDREIEDTGRSHNIQMNNRAGRKITMKDVAQKLGVSIVTVSKAFNGKEGVSDELRAQIKKTAEH